MVERYPMGEILYNQVVTEWRNYRDYLRIN